MAYQHQPSAFINTIAESGSKDEAVKHLQETWNEVVALRAALSEADSLIHAFISGAPHKPWRPGSPEYVAWQNHEQRQAKKQSGA